MPETFDLGWKPGGEEGATLSLLCTAGSLKEWWMTQWRRFQFHLIYSPFHSFNKLALNNFYEPGPDLALNHLYWTRTLPLGSIQMVLSPHFLTCGSFKVRELPHPGESWAHPFHTD